MYTKMNVSLYAIVSKITELFSIKAILIDSLRLEKKLRISINIGRYRVVAHHRLHHTWILFRLTKIKYFLVYNIHNCHWLQIIKYGYYNWKQFSVLYYILGVNINLVFLVWQNKCSIPFTIENNKRLYTFKIKTICLVVNYFNNLDFKIENFHILNINQAVIHTN